MLTIEPLEDPTERLSESNVSYQQEESLTNKKYVKHANDKSWWEEVTPRSETKKQNILATIPRDTLHLKGASVLEMVVPNLLNPRGKYGDVLSLTNLETPSSRLALFGGLPGILSHMTRDGAKPDVKTFLFLSLIVSPEMEGDMLAAMRSHGVKMDTTFLNNMIQKRNRRKDYAGAKELVAMVGKLGLSPDLKTFGWSAFACTTWTEANQLLTEMEDARLDPVVEIYAALLSKTGMDFHHKLKVIDHMEKTRTDPSHAVIKHLERDIEQAKRSIVDVEHRKKEFISRAMSNEVFKRNFEIFMKYYSGWLKRVAIDEPDHPWGAYRRPSPETLSEMAKVKEEESNQLLNS